MKGYYNFNSQTKRSIRIALPPPGANLISIIDREELAAFDNRSSLSSSNYIKLADMYRRQYNIEQEEYILRSPAHCFKIPLPF